MRPVEQVLLDTLSDLSREFPGAAARGDTNAPILSPSLTINESHTRPRSTKRIIWDHFIDSALLLSLELILVLIINNLRRYVPEAEIMISSVNLFSRWFIFAVLAQFAIESAIDVFLSDSARGVLEFRFPSRLSIVQRGGVIAVNLPRIAVVVVIALLGTVVVLHSSSLSNISH